MWGLQFLTYFVSVPIYAALLCVAILADYISHFTCVLFHLPAVVFIKTFLRNFVQNWTRLDNLGYRLLVIFIDKVELQPQFLISYY